MHVMHNHTASELNTYQTQNEEIGMSAASLPVGNRSVGLKDGENAALDWENNAGMLFELGMEMSVCCAVLLLFPKLHTELKLNSSVIIREERQGLEP